MKKCDFDLSYRKLVNVAEEYGYKVISVSQKEMNTILLFGSGYCDPIKKVICTTNKFNREESLILLSHELGHMIDFSRRDKKTQERLIFKLMDTTHRFNHSQKLPIKHQLFLYKWELDAWKLGKDLLVKLQIPIFKDTFRVLRGKSLFGYFLACNGE
jgi:hypothetical protein